MQNGKPGLAWFPVFLACTNRTGLVNAATPKMDVERGWKLENLVFMTLRRGLNRINYYSLEKNREVDFCVCDQLTGKSSLVQASWDISGGEEGLSPYVPAQATFGIASDT